MAYENQIKCIRCGKSIPPMPEDASSWELLCDLCFEEVEDEMENVQTIKEV
jgi:hypothetical protein